MAATTEANMLLDLCQGLGDDFWSAVPSPDPSPVKPKPLPRAPLAAPRTPTKSLQASGCAHPTYVLPSTVFAANDHDISSFLEGSENWNLDDDIFSPIKPTVAKVASQSPAVSRYIPDACTRCVVDSFEDEYVDGRWRKKILARIDSNEERILVYLYDDWYQTDIRTDDVFNVIGPLSPLSPLPSCQSSHPTRTISITSQSNLFILHPDLLLTATALSSASQCARKPVLSTLLRSATDIGPAMVWGNILHEVMQRCLQEGQWDEQFREEAIAEGVRRRLGDLVKIGLTEEVARREVSDRARGLGLFAERYLATEPKANGELTNTRAGSSDKPALLAIRRLLDIEEDIWSPTYGIKGKIDATVEGVIADSNVPGPSNASSSNTSGPRPLPLELKTGKTTGAMDHRAQTMLYTLLVGERYGADVHDGLLFYTQSENGDLVRVPRARNELRGLVAGRNVVAEWMWKRIRKHGKAKMEDVDMRDGTQGKNGEDGGEVEDIEDEEPFLPPPIDDERTCKRCFVLDSCLLFRKMHPNHYLASSSSAIALSSKARAKARAKLDPPLPPFLAPIFDEKTSHLSPERVDFFRKWERLLALEERDLVRFKRELWTLGAQEREEKGRCFAGMTIKQKKSGSSGISLDAGESRKDKEVVEGEGQRIHQFTYTFVRSSKWVPQLSKTRVSSQEKESTTSISHSISLLNGHLGVGDPVTVSVEPNMLALARGYILELTPDEVVLGVDHVLDVPSLQARVVRTGGKLGAGRAEDVFDAPKKEQDDEDELIFRIDKDELFGGMARVRSNLAALFFAGGDTRRLELVVDLRKPMFSAPTPEFSASASDSSIARPKKTLPSHLAHLNPSQLYAMEKVLSAEDYALVLGMPGTGKTTVIAALLRELVGRGKTVLLSSYTHSAVDTILMKLQGLWRDEAEVGANGVEEEEKTVNFGILRLGNVDKVHPDVRKYTLNARRTATTVEQLELQIMSPPVVATTCLSIEHPLFSRRHFDYCIVDEASQVTLPTCLGPLRFADTFVLVGDHFQLPPLVKNPEARKGGLDVSLFRRLSEAHPEAVVDLRFQYRMNKEIMLLSNHLIYEDRLRCGNEEVANRSLKLGSKHFLKRLHRAGAGGAKEAHLCPGGSAVATGQCWLERLSDPQCKAVFVDTDALPAYDSRVGDLVQNTTEAELVRQFTETLIQSGVQESQIGIITLYRQQVKVLRHLLPERMGVEILTADKSQGRDKDCIIISLVRSNEAGHIGDLVKDWRRMNVSFTRARKKLVIFGSRKTLEREPLLGQFFDLMQAQEWIVALPPHAHLAHAGVFDVCATPAKRTSEPDEDEKKPVVEPRLVSRKTVGKENTALKENSGPKEGRPMKKLKVGSDASKGAGAGILKGRPILRDLVRNERS